MLALLCDENFNGDIIRGLLLSYSELDLVRVQDVGLQSTDDPTILAWAVQHDRIVLTHDRATMPDFAYSRIAEGLTMPGIFVVNDRMAIRQVIDEILLLNRVSNHDEWSGIVLYLPL